MPISMSAKWSSLEPRVGGNGDRMAVAERVADARPADVAEGAGRLGLVGRGLLYVVIAVLAAQVALGQRTEQSDQRGALTELAERPYGTVPLVLLAAGFAGYATWRLVRAVRGEDPGDPSTLKRFGDVGRAAIHLSLLAATVAVLRGGGSGRDPAHGWTAELMARGWGRWVVGAAGLALLGYGAWQVWRGLSTDFRKHLERRRRSVVRFGVVGHVGRGLASGVIGWFVLRAAVRFDPAEPIGLDAALHDLATSTAGRLVVLAVAVGLACFGAYSMAESRDRRVLRG
jgi:hypothetical protein